MSGFLRGGSLSLLGTFTVLCCNETKEKHYLSMKACSTWAYASILIVVIHHIQQSSSEKDKAVTLQFVVKVSETLLGWDIQPRWW